MRKLIAGILLSTFSTGVYALDGADALLKNVGGDLGDNDGPRIETQQNDFNLNFKLDDAFLVSFFNEWRKRKLDFEINRWAKLVMQKENEKAAHLLSVIEKKAPHEFKGAVLGAKLYLYYKMGLSQTFVTEWLQNHESPYLKGTDINDGLKRVISRKPGQWLLDHPVSLSSELLALIDKVDESAGFFELSLKAYATINDGLAAQAMLPKLPDNSALKKLIAERALLQYARQGDLATAGRVLKRYIEPSISNNDNPKRLSAHYMTVARLLYQAGALEASVSFYDKIPTGAPNYLQSKAEVLWPLLRLGDVTRLRGEVSSLNSGVYNDSFLPDVYLVHAISNLKLCRYKDVQKNFADFISTNKKFGALISKKVKEANPTPDKTDWTLNLLNKRISYLSKEQTRLKSLSKKSIKAALPAVGVQAHWAQAAKNIEFALEREKKNKALENRRFWKNKQALLTSTIRKMRFVKVEAMTQIRSFAALAKANAKNKKEESTSSSQSDRVKIAQAAQLKGKIIFPFDGVVWPDELFNLYSNAETECLKGYK